MLTPKILLVTATNFELEPLLKKWGVFTQNKFIECNTHLHVLVTGVGMVNTAYSMGTTNLNNYDLIINTGICGAFNKVCKLADTVIIETDVFSELGAEDGDEFISINNLGLGENNSYSQNITNFKNRIQNYTPVKGITVNKVHGNDNSIAIVKKLFNPDVESMEGAAFFKCCKNSKAEFFQLRSVSNYVEKRDKSKWKIKEAIESLNVELETILKQIGYETNY